MVGNRSKKKSASRYKLYATHNKHRITTHTLRKRGVLVPVVAMICGLVLTQASWIRLWYQEHLLRPSKDQIEVVYVGGSVPVRLHLPEIIDLEIEQAILREGYYSVSQTKGTYLPISSRLGGRGNVIMYGHNLDWILGRLWRVKLGDEIVVTDERGEVWKYRVTNKVQVKPSELLWLEPTETEVLTIYTCAGFMDRERLVVRAERI
jgi:LPXTG-site transpeptidase (sortase) family protein